MYILNLNAFINHDYAGRDECRKVYQGGKNLSIFNVVQHKNFI